MLFVNRLFFIALIVLISACSDDINPSDVDRRTSSGASSQDFTVYDTKGNEVNLISELGSNDAVLLYFTMWCSICDAHMSSIRENIKPDFPDVRYLIIDYVSANSAQTENNQIAFGYASETVISDHSHELLSLYDGGMGSTIIINSDQTILLNEDYKASRVRQILESL